MKEKIDKLYRKGNKPLKDETLFKILTSLKIALIPTLTIAILISMLLMVLSFNLIFFKANGVSDVGGLQEAYFEYLSQVFLTSIPWLILTIFLITTVGFYISHIFLRPFRLIGDYCESFTKEGKGEYDQELFTDLRLLTSFSEYFFNTMENAYKEKEFAPITIMKKYQRVHQPVFEKTFFIQLFFILLILSLAGTVGIYFLTVDLHLDLIKLSLQMLKADSASRFFLNEQKDIFNQVILIVLSIHVGMYAVLCFHFHSMLSKPAFAIFATMRTFLKGDFDARIHLIGSRYIRSESIRINKYFEYLQKNIRLKK